MTDKELVVEYGRLLDPPTIEEHLKTYKLIADAAMQVIGSEEKVVKSEVDRYGHYLFQMTALKCLSVQKLVEEKLKYKNDISQTSISLYDPFGLQPITRAQFEAYGHFNNLFLQNNSEDKKELKYCLWAMSGLMNRQKLNASTPETITKKAKEKLEIDELENLIKNNPCFKSLNDKSQKLIFEKAKVPDWKLTVSGDRAIFVGWQQLVKNAGTNTMMDNLYTSFSLGAHPSYVSVFKFRDAYGPGEQVADFFTLMELKLSKIFVSFFIADYCRHSPEGKAAFDKLPVLHQLLVNGYDRMFRAEEYQINNIWDKFVPILEEAIINGEVE